MVCALPDARVIGGGDVALCAGLSGIDLLAWRDSGAMALLLARHPGVVMALFVTLP